MWFLEVLGWFFAGVFLINAVPHLVNGVSGNRFPSPFAKPHGKKLSSPVLNVVWAFTNLAVGLVIIYFDRASFNKISVVVMFGGAFLMGLFLALYFANKDRE